MRAKALDTIHHTKHLQCFLGNTCGKAQLCGRRQGEGPASLFLAHHRQVPSRGFARILEKSVQLALVIALASISKADKCSERHVLGVCDLFPPG
jgi:hypothetical protein